MKSPEGKKIALERLD